MAPLIVSSLSITFTHSFLHGTQDTALSYIPALLIYVTIKVYCQLYWLWDPSMGLVEYISSVLGVVHRFNLKVYVWPLLLSTLGLLPCVLSISWPHELINFAPPCPSPLMSLTWHLFLSSVGLRSTPWSQWTEHFALPWPGYVPALEPANSITLWAELNLFLKLWLWAIVSQVQER